MKKRTGTAGIRTAAVIMITAVMFSFRVFAADTLPSETVQGTENTTEEITEVTSEEVTETTSAEITSEEVTETTSEETTESVEGSEKANETEEELPAQEGQKSSGSAVELPVVELPASQEENEELSEEPSENTASEGEEASEESPAQGQMLAAQRGTTGQETEADSVIEEQVSDEENPIPAAFRVAMDRVEDRIHFITLNTNGSSSDATLIESNGLYGLIDTSNPSPDGGSNRYDAYIDADANGEDVVSYLRSLDITHLSFVLVTHAHSDHNGGVGDIVKNGFVDDTTVYIYKNYYSKNNEMTGTSEDSYWHNDYFFNQALKTMQDENVNAVLLDTSDPQQEALDMLGAVINSDPSGDSIGDNLSFTMGDFLIKLYNLYKVSVTNENLNSIVTTVQKDEARAVLMADMQLAEGMEDRVVSAIVRNDDSARTAVFKVGHHGYANSTGVNTVETLKPDYAVVSTRSTISGPENKAYYNYLMGILGTKIYRTSEARTALVADFLENDKVQIHNPIWSIVDGKLNEIKLGLVPWDAVYTNGWQQWIATSSGTSSYLYIQNGKAVRDKWEEINRTWYYFDDNCLMHIGWKQIGSYTFYLDPSGAMHKEWLQEGGKWYYLNGYGILQKDKTLNIGGSNYTFDEEGVLKAAWVCINSGWYYLKADGSVTKGWDQIGSNWYYFNSNGVMQKNMWASEGGKKYYVDGYGIRMTGPGWNQIGGNWYYLQNDGAVTTGMIKLDGKTYYFDNAGVMQKNKWISVEGRQYNLDGWGVVRSGWAQISGKWYYFDPTDGNALAKGITQIDDHTYVMDPNTGAMIVNSFVDIDGKTYGTNGWGYLQSGWSQVQGKWYYFDPIKENQLAKGITQIGDYTYLLDPKTGIMIVNGFVDIDGKTYGANGWGYLQSGWSQVQNKWYYFDPENGNAMAKGITQIGDYTYLLDPKTGMMTINSWTQIGKDWYHSDGWGYLQTGWLGLNGHWYYLDPENHGAMVKSKWITVDSKHYYLDGYGIMKSGPRWEQIDGSWYYLNAGGDVATGLTTIGGSIYYMDANGVMQKNMTVTIDGVTYQFNGYGIGTIISR